MEVIALGYVGLETQKVDEWAMFAPEVLGLAVSEGDANGTRLFRMDERCYRLAVHPGESDRLAYLGFEVPNAAALEHLSTELGRAGASVRWADQEDCKRRRVRGLLYSADPSGNPLEFFFGQKISSDPFHSPRSMTGFVTGQLGMGHAVLEVTDLQQSLDFYANALKFRISDYFANLMVFLHCNPRHHSIALAKIGGAPRLRHLMLEVRDPDDVGRTYDLCYEKGVTVTKALGRHSNDHVYSFYLQTPSGFEIEFGYGGIHIDDTTWTVKQLDRASIWGHHQLQEGGRVRGQRLAAVPD